MNILFTGDLRFIVPTTAIRTYGSQAIIRYFSRTKFVEVRCLCHIFHYIGIIRTCTSTYGQNIALLEKFGIESSQLS
jgi:hypothetical protein